MKRLRDGLGLVLAFSIALALGAQLVRPYIPMLIVLLVVATLLELMIGGRKSL